jgi:hypothetical protein
MCLWVFDALLEGHCKLCLIMVKVSSLDANLEDHLKLFL